jgi:hypothetical protein
MELQVEALEKIKMEKDMLLQNLKYENDKYWFWPKKKKTKNNNTIFNFDNRQL